LPFLSLPLAISPTPNPVTGIKDKMGKPRLPERLKPHRPLSTVVEENENEDESEVQRDMSGNGHGHKANETGKGKKRDVDTNTNTNIKTEYEDDGEALPIEIDVHGLKAKVYANCSDVDIVPARYLEKADRSRALIPILPCQPRLPTPQFVI
jgi:hypothetical protein